MDVIPVIAAVITLVPPLTGILIILLGDAYPPRSRSALGLGTTVLLTSLALAILGSGTALIEGRQPFVPYVVVAGLPALAVARIMHLELNQPLQHSEENRRT